MLAFMTASSVSGVAYTVTRLGVPVITPLAPAPPFIW